jgi:hypothetical protein
MKLWQPENHLYGVNLYNWSGWTYSCQKNVDFGFFKVCWDVFCVLSVMQWVEI